MSPVVTLPCVNAKYFQTEFISMYLAWYDYSNNNCFQVGQGKKKKKHRKEKSQYSLKEKNISLPCLLDSFWQRAVSSCGTQFHQSLSPEKKKKKIYIHNCISEIWFGKSAFVSNASSLLNHVYKHFPSSLWAFCLPLHTPKYHPLLRTASHVFSLGRGIKHWLTSKAAIKFTSFIDQQEVHPPYPGQCSL